MPRYIERLFASKRLNIANGASETETVPVTGYAWFSVFVPTGTEGTHIAVLDVPETGAGATAVLARDNAGTLLVVPFTANESVVLPAATGALQRIQLRTCSAAAGTAQTQTGAAVLELRMKS